MSSIAWFTFPLNRAQVVVSMGTLLLLPPAGPVVTGPLVSREATLETLSELFSMLLDRLREKKLACKKSLFHFGSSAVDCALEIR